VEGCLLYFFIHFSELAFDRVVAKLDLLNNLLVFLSFSLREIGEAVYKRKHRYRHALKWRHPFKPKWYTTSIYSLT